MLIAANGGYPTALTTCPRPVLTPAVHEHNIYEIGSGPPGHYRVQVRTNLSPWNTPTPIHNQGWGCDENQPSWLAIPQQGIDIRFSPDSNSVSRG